MCLILIFMIIISFIFMVYIYIKNCTLQSSNQLENFSIIVIYVNNPFIYLLMIKQTIYIFSYDKTRP